VCFLDAKIRNWPNWSENVTSNGDEQLLEGNLSWISDIIEIDVVDEIFSSTETQTTSSSISLVLFSFFILVLSTFHRRKKQS